jgi:hypothetical protein
MRRQPGSDAPQRRPIMIEVDPALVAYFRKAAAARGTSVKILLDAVLQAVASDDLVGAVIDVECDQKK